MTDRHILEEEAEAFVCGEAVPEWAARHLKEWALDHSCTCHNQMFLALDAYLYKAEERGEAVAARRHLERLGDLLTKRHLCPEDMQDLWYAREDPHGLREAAKRHLRYCVRCRQELGDILEVMTPGTYESLPDLVPE